MIRIIQRNFTVLQILGHSNWAADTTCPNTFANLQYRLEQALE